MHRHARRCDEAGGPASVGCEGTYNTEAANTPFSLTNGVAYYGGFSGFANRSSRTRHYIQPVTLQSPGVMSLQPRGRAHPPGWTASLSLVVPAFSSGGDRLGDCHLSHSIRLQRSPAVLSSGNNTNPLHAAKWQGQGRSIFFNSNPQILCGAFFSRIPPKAGVRAGRRHLYRRLIAYEIRSNVRFPRTR